MDFGLLLSFAIPIAQQVIGQLISEFVAGRRRAATKRDLQTMSAGLVAKRYGQLVPAQARAVNDYALSEMRLLAHEHPDLEWHLNRLRPKPVPDEVRSAQDVNRTIAVQLRELDELVRTRRLALGLPTTEAGGPVTRPPAGDVLPLDTVEPRSSRDYWKGRIARANEEIVSWRARFPAAEDDEDGRADR
ncbi:hypothetical protein K1W54_22185 [Micromonospora sp. CPCC 205371]|nr:hypothetical protein [Micromonospora sp. CPCC 205371]